MTGPGDWHTLGIMAAQLLNALIPKENRQEIIWGPVRLAIGVLQLTFAPLTFYYILAEGIDQLSTWLLVAFTTLVTITSRLLYGGRKGSD